MEDSIILENIINYGAIILVQIILILFSRLILKLYSTKDPRLSEDEIKALKENIAKRELTLYILNIVLSIIVIFSLQEQIQIFAIILAFIIGFSIIFRVLKKIKISNILCAIIVVPIIIYLIGVIVVDIGDTLLCSSSNKNYYNELEITSFNQKFTQYEGIKTGAQIKALLQQVVASNVNEENQDKQIEVDGSGISAGTVFIKSGAKEITGLNFIKNKKKYIVSIHRSKSGINEGFVDKITISDN